jgi:hypothetical protein
MTDLSVAKDCFDVLPHLRKWDILNEPTPFRVGAGLIDHAGGEPTALTVTKSVTANNYPRNTPDLQAGAWK